MVVTKLMIITILTALLSAASIYGIYHTHQLPTEETRILTLCTYENVGNYDYTAKLKPNNIYNRTTLRPGEGTLYTRILEHIDIAFTYTFECSRPAEGIIEYSITTSLQTPNWNKTLSMTPWNATNLTGPAQELRTSHFVNPTTYEEIIRAIDKETGTSTSEYSLIISHRIHTQAKTDAGDIDKHFTPTLRITFKPRSPEGDIITIDGLNHKSPDAVIQVKKTYLPWVTYQRYASYAFSAVTIPALTYVAWLLIKTRPMEKPLREVVKPYEEIVAEAGEPSYEGRKATITMNSLEDLAKVAEALAKPLLHTQKNQTHTYYVLDGLTKYEYIITASIIEKKPENHTRARK